MKTKHNLHHHSTTRKKKEQEIVSKRVMGRRAHKWNNWLGDWQYGFKKWAAHSQMDRPTTLMIKRKRRRKRDKVIRPKSRASVLSKGVRQTDTLVFFCSKDIWNYCLHLNDSSLLFRDINKAGYTGNTSLGRVGRVGNAHFLTFRLDGFGRTNQRMDRQSLL